MKENVIALLVIAACISVAGVSAATVEQTDVSTFEFHNITPGDEVSIRIDGMVETPGVLAWTGVISTTTTLEDTTLFYDLSELRVGSILFAGEDTGCSTSWGRNGDSVGEMDMGDLTANEQYTLLIAGLPYYDNIHIFMDFSGIISDTGDFMLILPTLPEGSYAIDILVNGEMCVTTTNARGSWVACSFYSDSHTFEEYRVGDPVIEDTPKSRIETVLASRGRVAAMVQR